MAYSGWTNLATYQVHLWFGEMFECQANGGFFVSEDYVRDTVYEYVYSEVGGEPSSGLAADILGCALSSVNWQELAEQYQKGYETEED